jgi:hypothetical protein
MRSRDSKQQRRRCRARNATSTVKLIVDNQTVPLRIAFGVCTFEAGLSAAEMLSSADGAMFENSP